MPKISELKNISLSYFDKKIINNISLSIYEDEIISIIGLKGSGKTTLGKIISLLLKDDEGEIFFYDSKIDFNSCNFKSIRKNIGFVFQNPKNQFFGFRVEDDIAFGLENNLISRDDMKDKIFKVAKEIGISHLLNKDTQHLSGGQKQKIAIADMLALEPKIIIFDESFSMIDNSSKKEILNLIKDIKNEYHITVIFITYDLDETLNSNRVIVMEKGEIFLIGKPEEIYIQEEKLKTIGMDIPFIFKLNKKLKEAFLIKKENYILEDLVKKICK